jgi:hypothetical protein
MSDIRNIERAVGSKVRRPQMDERLWVRARDVAYFLSVSLSAVYQGQSGCQRIRSARIPGAGQKRQARRYYWPDVLAIHEEMLAETEKREEVPANILRLFGRRRGRRKES